MSKLLLIDGYSLLYRAFFSSPPFSTSKGEPTGALYGFVRMVTRLLDENAPDYVVVAIDAPGGTFRHEADATYKAQRSDAPDDLKIQQRLVRELLDGLSIPRYEHVGFEADDVIGTLARHGEAHGQEVLIVTGDGDQLQLASDKVQVLLTRKGVSELEAYGPKEVVERYGFEPRFVPDFKGLKGDASDNIPGIPGIGDKTASALLQKFGSLDGIYEHIEEVAPARIQGLLRDHQEQAFHSRHMATIVCDLPVEAEPEDFRYEPFDPEKRKKAAETARRFEFKSLVARYQAPPPAGSAPQAEPIAAKQLEFELRTTDAPGEVESWIAKQGKNAHIALTLLEDGWMLAHDGQVLFFSGEAGELRSFLEDPDAPKIVNDEKGMLRALAHIPSAQPSGTGSLFDEAQATEGGQGIALQGVRADTMLMSWLLDPTRQGHPTDYVAQKFLRYTLPPLPEAPKKRGKNASLFDEGPSETETQAKRQHFAAATAVLCELEPVMRQELEEIGADVLLDELELPLVPVLSGMERVGMQLDPQPLRELGVKLDADLVRLQGEVWALAGREFSIGSPKQLQEVLYQELKLDTSRKNKSGGFTTDAFALEKLAEDHEIARKVLDWRQANKLKTTYVDALLSLMNPATHRIHSNLNQTGTVTGRLSSSEPNLQNVPIRTEQGRLIRKAFVAPSGKVILSADYSQIELRILAHITGDAPLVDAFQNGEDVHARTASALFGVDVKDVDREQRRLSKMTNYAIAYGVSGFGLAKQLGGGRNAGEAQKFIETYFATFPGIKKYIDDTLAEGRRLGYVQTLMGRRRPMPDLNANAFQVRSAAERTAINHPIQGTSADIMKMAMIAVARELRERGLSSSLTMQVHDELVFEVPTEEIEEVSALVKEVMSTVPVERLKLRVPLLAEVGTGPNWEDTKANKE